jgi:S-adenosylmethionine:tRNA ribosyltransferase-isomerase
MDSHRFDYDLPPDRIAQEAIEPRDASRLLITSDLTDVPFRRLPDLFDPGDLIVVNTTRVRRARLVGARVDTGGTIEILVTRRIDDRRWEGLARPARRLRAGVTIALAGRLCTLLTDPIDGVVTMAFDPSSDVEEAIEAHGSVPLPPYFTGELDDEDRYQTMFASRLGSAAAPTAALHFTEGVVQACEARGVRFANVELEVGLDTFRPMASDDLDRHEIHTESVHVDDEAVAAIAAARDRGSRVIAVGTTVIRALETAGVGNGYIGSFHGPTDLFITPGYRFSVIDGAITNFHAPRTTLIVLVAAMMGDRWREVYEHAISAGFRFLSFGDAMYIEVNR